jgi:hypothetical protein
MKVSALGVGYLFDIKLPRTTPNSSIPSQSQAISTKLRQEHERIDTKGAILHEVGARDVS